MTDPSQDDSIERLVALATNNAATPKAKACTIAYLVDQDLYKHYKPQAFIATAVKYLGRTN